MIWMCWMNRFLNDFRSNQLAVPLDNQDSIEDSDNNHFRNGRRLSRKDEEIRRRKIEEYETRKKARNYSNLKKPGSKNHGTRRNSHSVPPQMRPNCSSVSEQRTAVYLVDPSNRTMVLVATTTTTTTTNLGSDHRKTSSSSSTTSHKTKPSRNKRRDSKTVQFSDFDSTHNY